MAVEVETFKLYSLIRSECFKLAENFLILKYKNSYKIRAR